MKNTIHLSNKVGIILVVALVLFFASLLLYIKFYSKPHTEIYIPNVVGEELTQDPKLVSDAKQLGIDYSPINWEFVESIPNTNYDDITPGTAIIGGFTAPNSIQVKSGMGKQQELQTVAYEYLHYKWTQYTPNQKAKLENLLQRFYDNKLYFREATKAITGSADVLGDERNSMACTVIQPYLLTQAFNDYCDSLIPNRTILFP